jgi:sporulation protein YlmC with PRC-barrel domain
MFLAREVLDKELDDRYGYKAGKVDDLLLEIGEGGLPEVVAILTGPNSIARLLPGWLDRLTTWIRTSLLGLEEMEPIEIEWSHVTRIDVAVHVDLDRDDAGLMKRQHTIWRRWLKPLPFSER